MAASARGRAGGVFDEEEGERFAVGREGRGVEEASDVGELVGFAGRAGVEINLVLFGRVAFAAGGGVGEGLRIGRKDGRVIGAAGAGCDELVFGLGDGVGLEMDGAVAEQGVGDEGAVGGDLDLAGSLDVGTCRHGFGRGGGRGSPWGRRGRGCRIGRGADAGARAKRSRGTVAARRARWGESHDQKSIAFVRVCAAPARAKVERGQGRALRAPASSARTMVLTRIGILPRGFAAAAVISALILAAGRDPKFIKRS